MRKQYIIISLLSIFLIACAVQRANKIFIGNWQEKEFAFTESIFHQTGNDLIGLITTYKWCCGTGESRYSEKEFTWLRQEENLWQTYNILKKIGIERIISRADYTQILFNDSSMSKDWKAVSLKDVVRNMIDSYDMQNDTTDYYQKFWQRRKHESNAEIVLKIIKDMDSFYTTSKHIEIEEDIINQDLYHLIKYNVELNECDSLMSYDIALDYFQYLKSIGLHHSAYNLIFETDIINDLKINKDSLLQTLSFDTIPEEHYWYSRNNAQWIKTYKDNGP